MPNNNDFDIIKMHEGADEFEDISSNYTDISSSRKPKKKKRKKKNVFLRILCVLLALVLVAVVAFGVYAYRLIDSMPRSELDRDDLGISSSVYSDVKNIALFGLDSRKDTASGRSDAIMILTVDKKHKKIKLTSIARDAYVQIEGKGGDKLTHAYAYGRAPLAVKTLNQNFGLEITDYVTMNFFGFANAIDYIGGVTIDVDEKELGDMNNNTIPRLNKIGIKAEKLEKAGVQLLTGAQALCYSRIRHVDSDIMRGNRQREVISAVFEKIKTMNVTKLPTLANMIISECETSLSTSDIMSLGTWAVTSGAEIEQLSIPNDNIDSQGKIISGRWYYWIDLEGASDEIYDFIFEENYYSPEQKALRESEEEK